MDQWVLFDFRNDKDTADIQLLFQTLLWYGVSYWKTLGHEMLFELWVLIIAKEAEMNQLIEQRWRHLKLRSGPDLPQKSSTYQLRICGLTVKLEEFVEFIAWLNSEQVEPKQISA